MACLSPASVAPEALAFDLTVGAGAIDSGDDRSHGVAMTHLGFPNQWMTQIYYWGRVQRPVTETNVMISVGKQYDLSSSKSLHAAVGVTALSETTEITYADFPEENSKSTSTNAGLLMGVSWDIYKSGAMKLNAAWEGHVFPAGGAALYLVSGRKQVLALTAGVSL